MYTRAATIAATLSLALAGAASAQGSRCIEVDLAAADAATARGFALYHSATHDASQIDQGALLQALAAADRGCALGRAGALLLRAFVTHALGREVEAARAIDGFVAAVPDAARSRRQREDLAQLVAATAPLVSRVRVRSELDGARVTLDAAELEPGETSPHAPGVAVLRASAPGYEPAERTLSLGAGRTVMVRVVAGETVGDDVLALRRIPSPSPVATASALSLPRRQSERPLRPWWIASAATTGVTFVAAVGFTVWREERASTYTGLSCGPASTSAECVARYSEFDTADTLRTVGWVATGVFAATTAALWWLDRRDVRALRGMTVGCAASPGGVRCAW